MELIVILVLALVVLGPQRIPEVASSLGKAIRSFRKATKELRDHIDIEDEVRRPFEDLRAALRDEPARYKPPALMTAVGDPNFPAVPLDPNFVPSGHGPAFGVNGPADVAVYEPHPESVPLTAAAADPALAAGTAVPTAAPTAAPAAPALASLVGPPAEPVVSANSGAEHFQRAAQPAPSDKAAS